MHSVTRTRPIIPVLRSQLCTDCYCYRAYTRGDHRRNRSERLQAIVAATVACCQAVGCSIKQVFVAATIACSVYTGRLSRQQSPLQSPTRLVYTLQAIVAPNPTVAATIDPCIRPISVSVTRFCKLLTTFAILSGDEGMCLNGTTCSRSSSKSGKGKGRTGAAPVHPFPLPDLPLLLKSSY